jgi:hypothetical protein
LRFQHSATPPPDHASAPGTALALHGGHRPAEPDESHHQEQHHRRSTFQEEFLALMKKHRIEHDERPMSD